MQQRTYDFLAKLKVPMLTFGGELMGEAVEMVVDDLNSHRFMSMRDIEASLADKFNCSPGVADRRMRYALDMGSCFYGMLFYCMSIFHKVISVHSYF